MAGQEFVDNGDTGNVVSQRTFNDSSKTVFAVVIIIQVLVLLVIPKVLVRLVQGATSWVDLFYLTLSILGGLGVWIILRNRKGKTNIPLWLGQVLGLLPVILMIVSGLFLMFFYMVVKYW